MRFTNDLAIEAAFSSNFARGMASAKPPLGTRDLTVMPNKTNRTKRYRDNFKQAAAEFTERNGWSVEQSASELGVDAADLRQWTEKFASRSKPAKPLSGVAQLRAENEALRNQVLQLQVQWDILKTTLGVLSTTVCSQEAA